jgi:hypothetical protein
MFAVACQTVCAQTQPSQPAQSLQPAQATQQPQPAQPSADSDNVDQLFNGNGSNGASGNAQSGSSSGGTGASQGPSTTQQPSTQTTTPPATSANAIRPDDLLNDNKLHVFGSFDVYGNVGGGWSEIPDLSNLSNNLGRDIGGSLTSSLGFEIRPVNELRLRGTLTYTFPGAGAESLPQLSEMYGDFSVQNAVFFRLGIFGYTWGNSQFYQFGNLPARSIPGWTGNNNLPFWEQNNILTTVVTTNYPVSLKMSVPMGLNTLSLLARFDLINYGFPSPTAPDPKDAGYGLEYDLVTGPVEWSLGGFYQRELTPRTLLSLKTHFLGIDLSAETTWAFPVTFSTSGIAPIPTAGGGIDVGGTLQRIYPTAVLGLSREWTDLNIKLYAEYAYNGERTPGTSWLPDETGPGGHNSAIGARFGNLTKSGADLNVLWQENWSDGSGLFAPFFEFSPVGLTTIQVGVPFVWGPDGSEVPNNRLVPGSLRLELLILVRVSESFRQ